MRKIPLRTCVITKEKLPKQELLRVVRNKEGEVFVDLTGKSNGRGAYIKKDITVLEKLMKNNALGKHLECDINDDVYESIKKVIESR